MSTSGSLKTFVCVACCLRRDPFPFRAAPYVIASVVPECARPWRMALTRTLSSYLPMNSPMMALGVFHRKSGPDQTFAAQGKKMGGCRWPTLGWPVD
jgi:hypothetical protein